MFGYRIKRNPKDLESVMQQVTLVREITNNSFFTLFQTVRYTVEIQPPAANRSYTHNLPPNASPPAPEQSRQAQGDQQGRVPSAPTSKLLRKSELRKPLLRLLFSLVLLVCLRVSVCFQVSVEMSTGNPNKNTRLSHNVYYYKIYLKIPGWKVTNSNKWLCYRFWVLSC